MESLINQANTPHPSIHRKIWHLAGPLMLSNISIPLLGIIDTVILGHLDQAIYLGAVSIGANVMAMILWSFSFLRTGTTSIIAQHHGAQASNDVFLSLLRAILLGLVIAAALVVLKDPIIRLALDFVASSHHVDVLAKRYCTIRFYSLPAMLIMYCITGWLIGIQKTRSVMLIIISTNLINILLDLLFIIELDMSSDGAAWATVVAEYVGGTIALCLLTRSYRDKPWPTIGSLFQTAPLAGLLTINANLFLRTCCLLFCFLFFTAKGAQQNDSILAANAILLQLLLLSAFALDGFAHAAESLCGNAIGAKKNGAFHKTVNACLLWSASTSALMTLGFFASRELVVYGYSSIPVVQSEVAQYYNWLLFMPLIAVWSYLFDGVFIGAAKTAAMRNSMLFCTFAVFLPAWWLLQPYNNHGLWLAFVLFSGMRGVTLAGYFWFYVKLGC